MSNVGVANLATRAASSRPYPVRWESALAGRLIGTPTVRFKIWGRLQNRTRHVGEALSLPQCTQLSCSMNGETCVGVANLATRAASSRPYSQLSRFGWKSAPIFNA